MSTLNRTAGTVVLRQSTIWAMAIVFVALIVAVSLLLGRPTTNEEATGSSSAQTEATEEVVIPKTKASAEEALQEFLVGYYAGLSIERFEIDDMSLEDYYERNSSKGWYPDWAGYPPNEAAIEEVYCFRVLMYPEENSESPLWREFIVYWKVGQANWHIQGQEY